MKIGCLFMIIFLSGVVQYIYLNKEFPDKKYWIFSVISGGITLGVTLGLMLHYELYFLDVWKRAVVLMLVFTVALTDYKEMRISNQVLLFGLGVRIIFYVLEWVYRKDMFLDFLKLDGIGFGIIFLFFLLAGIIIKNGVGMGDIKLMLVMSLYMGVQGVFGVLFMSLVCMFFAGLFVLITRKKKKGDSMPFAPAILAGTVISLLINGI